MSNTASLEDAFGQLSIDRHANGRIDRNPLTFSNFSDSLIQKIIERCEVRDHLVLRKVSKRLRALVDSSQLKYGIKFSCRRDHILLEIIYRGKLSNQVTVVYAGDDWNSGVVFSNIAYNSEYLPDETIAISVENQCKLIKSEDYERLAFDDLAIALKTPKQEVGCFTFGYYVDSVHMPITIQDAESSKRCYEKIKALLSSLNHKLFVRRLKLVVEDPEDVMAILPRLVPTFLHEIAIYSEVSSNRWQNQENIQRIVNAQQWITARSLLRTQNVFAFFPMESLMNFKRLRINECSVDAEFLLKLRELFSKSPILCKCYIESGEKFDAEVLAEHVGEPASSTQWSSNVRHYQLPNTDEFLEFQFHGDTISIRRYSRDVPMEKLWARKKFKVCKNAKRESV
ncbi:hypothetical protein CRE_06936 [Caenorhabditis remanei]|uniref:F-box domain-containing protein n=1 Tax=Caenorhabditis remanei TaxID=31234 RepID=E3N6N7_CAERE|nr:hypothetical protein CRE_06936 [Caenorhabditis remanei]